MIMQTQNDSRVLSLKGSWTSFLLWLRQFDVQGVASSHIESVSVLKIK